MRNKILGLDVGTNSVGWALLEAESGKPKKIIDLGCRIFTKAVEEKTPTPKNQKRREARLARRVIQRRARRKRRMLNYLVKLELLPEELRSHSQPEKILNKIGNPYFLRAKALDEALSPYEMGRVFLHLVQRRGFLSNRKTLMGDMIDDPDVQDLLDELEEGSEGNSVREKEETAFKADISKLRSEIDSTSSRTLGEHLFRLGHHELKRNRKHGGSHLRTDRQMYLEEFGQIWQQQAQHHKVLTEHIRSQLEEIIFYQRPLKIRSDRVGKCSLEPSRKRARMAKLEAQRFRYLQDINNLKYLDPYQEQWTTLTADQKAALRELFEHESNVTITKIRKCLGLDRTYAFNLEAGNKKIRGNATACEIRRHFSGWDDLDDAQQHELVEDLVTINKKSVLKKRLINHWGFDSSTAVNLCLMQLEPGHANHSIKAMVKLMPFLLEGQIYSDARVSAGYGYEVQQRENADRLGPPPDIPNPIVSRGLGEVRRVVNAIIAEHGKPDVIRVEMARDLEMNTKRYKAFLKQQKANTNANDEAVEKYREMSRKNPHLKLANYPSYADKIKYRLWKDQEGFCAYSLSKISLSQLFGPEVEVDHILPYSQSLDDSYMNKVVCLTAENRFKGQRTPIDAYSKDVEKWDQMTSALSQWPRQLRSKQQRFYMTESELQKRDFISSQLNDTRYISRAALGYLAQLGCDVTTTKGQITSWLRHQWGLNTLIGETSQKERTDHRHHTIDAVVIACVDRSFYKFLVGLAKDLERSRSELQMRDLHIDPPWQNLRLDLQPRLDNMLVSHSPQTKLSGAIHEETGVGYIDGIGNVTRVLLDSDFKPGRAKKIYDATVREIVTKHLAKFDNNPKLAFAPDVTVLHKDKQTPIKRVRIKQSDTTLEKLERTKFGIKDKDGKVFKWHAFGNLHHVEVIRNVNSGLYSGIFVTMAEAHRRAKGINQPPEPIIRERHGDDVEFVMALHINDTVSLEKNGERLFYRVQKLDVSNKRVHLRLHYASTLNNSSETLTGKEQTIPALVSGGLRKHVVNAIGKFQA